VPSAKPNVTIFADASHDGTARVAGWGAWIKADGRPSIACGAAMKQAIPSTVEAELCALANALVVARLRGVLAHRDVVMLQSDCLVALAIIRSKIPGVADRPAVGGLAVGEVRKMKLTRLHSAAVTVISEIVTTFGVTLVTRHVRGHQPGGGRQWVNAEVDRIARDAMRERRSQRRLEAQPAEAQDRPRGHPHDGGSQRPEGRHRPRRRGKSRRRAGDDVALPIAGPNARR
jgi:ribonuclease HI